MTRTKDEDLAENTFYEYSNAAENVRYSIKRFGKEKHLPDNTIATAEAAAIGAVFAQDATKFIKS